MPKNRVLHKAGWILPEPKKILENGFIYVDSGIIKDVGKGKGPACNTIIDHGPGAIIPGLVNAHTHLELSALKKKVDYQKGFKNWVGELLKQRESISFETLENKAKAGIKELAESGCCVVGEISTLGITWEILSKSGLSGIWFKEFIGNSLNENIKWKKKKTLKLSLAGHAPHTLSPEMLSALKNTTSKRNLPLSIHLAESEDELEFLSTGKGEWADFLTERGVDFGNWYLNEKSPVQYLNRLGILDDKTIAVHIIFSEKKDFKILAEKNTHVCICPRSNQNLHQSLPDLELMLKSGINVCMGTDSLASTDSLNIFDEMKFTAQSFPEVSPEKIIAMATVNGAKALGIENSFGTLYPNHMGAFAYVPVNSKKKSNVVEAIVFNNC